MPGRPPKGRYACGERWGGQHVNCKCREETVSITPPPRPPALHNPQAAYRIVAPPAAIKKLPWYVRSVLWVEEMLHWLRLWRGERQQSIEWRHCATCPNPQHCAEGDGCMGPLIDPLADERRLAQLFIDVPGAAWLDPNLYGDDPNWRARLFPPKPHDHPWPTLAKRTATAIRDKCERCGDDLITKKGNRRGTYTTLCKGCGDYRHADDDDYDMPEPPKMPGAHLPDQPDPRITLPCGCDPGSLTKYGPIGNGATWVRCGRCSRWWEPPSNSNDWKLMAQGEHVHDRDDATPGAELAWEKEAMRINAGMATNHGRCPSDLCQYPVAKRDGLYYCTNTDCNHHDRGWK